MSDALLCGPARVVLQCVGASLDVAEAPPGKKVKHTTPNFGSTQDAYDWALSPELVHWCVRRDWAAVVSLSCSQLVSRVPNHLPA